MIPQDDDDRFELYAGVFLCALLIVIFFVVFFAANF